VISYDHIYVERDADETPLGREIIARLAPGHVTRIDDAQRFFKRPAQDFSRQKRAPRLILARKSAPFLYRGTERIASFGRERSVYYNDMVRNCLFDCDYCFLQGMHRSANVLVNVNIEDYLAAVDDHLRTGESLYLSISYLTDLLGFERSFGLARHWIEAARTRPDLEVEIRTKSDGFAALTDVAPHDGVILTWSLSPDAVARRSEAGTAAFAQRVLDARRAASLGWRVRICFDPVIVAEGWRHHYGDAVEQLFRRVPAEAIEEVSFGVFRMHPDFLDRITAFRSAPVLRDGLASRISGEDDASPHQVASYEEEIRREVFSFMEEALAHHLPLDRIHGVHG
jgi:spore photoproduct lyase